MEGMIREYKSYLEREERSRATISKYIHDVTAFFFWAQGRKVEKTLVLAYKKMLIEKYAPKSVNSVISSLNSFFDYINRSDCRVKTLKIQRQTFYDNMLTKQEYMRLVQAAKGNRRLYYLLQTIASTGIRVSELRYITVEAVKMKQAEINCKGKIRTVILPKELCRMLKEYIKKRNIKSGSVFVTKTGKPLDRSNIWAEMKGLCEKARVERKKVFPHNLRHLFAVTFYTKQKDIVRLADVLGHSSIDTTRIYTMESGDTHRRQVESMQLIIT